MWIDGKVHWVSDSPVCSHCHHNYIYPSFLVFLRKKMKRVLHLPVNSVVTACVLPIMLSPSHFSFQEFPGVFVDKKTGGKFLPKP